jgi:two-component system LytT family response regulator
MKTKYKALIVDDEELARSDLKALLSKFEIVEVIGEAKDVSSATTAVQLLKPDVIFLDIQFPRESGFDLLEKIDTSAKIIFVTAFDKYAIRAFEVNAQDYLIKPVDPERLALTIERLESEEKHVDKMLSPFNYDDAVFLEHHNKYYFVRINTIIKISAEAYYTEIITTKGLKILVSKSMKEWEARLPQNSFVRVHRSVIVNIEFVEKIEQWFNYSYRAYLKGIEAPVPISRRYISLIRNRMS